MFFFQPRLAFAELSLDLISELSCNVSVPIFWDCTLSVTTNTLDSIPKHQHNNNVSLSGSPSPLPGTGTYITPPADPLDLLVCELRKCVAVVLVFKLCGRKHFKTSLVSAHLADVTRKPRLITISSLSSAAVWQKQISLQIDDFCHMAYFIPALIFLSAVVITLSLMLFIKIAQAVAENSHRVGLCVCVILRKAWLVSGRGQRGPKSWGATFNLPKEEDVPHSWTCGLKTASVTDICWWMLTQGFWDILLLKPRSCGLSPWLIIINTQIGGSVVEGLSRFHLDWAAVQASNSLLF